MTLDLAFHEHKTMVVGLDVTHPSPGSQPNAPSIIAGMVASVDSIFAQWPATLQIQSAAHRVIVLDREDMLRTRLFLWKSKGGHKQLPKNILVYRDGISQGQYQTVLHKELPTLRKACNKLYPATDQKMPRLPRFTIIIVGSANSTTCGSTQTREAC